MTRRQILLIAGVVLSLLTFCLVWVVPNFIYHPIGYCVGSPTQVRACRGYGFWSGIAGSFVMSVLTGSGLWSGAFMWWLHTRCDTPGCLRKGKYRTADGNHLQCRGCFPDVPDRKLTRKEIHDRHHAASPTPTGESECP